jgi:hypothetical protein
MLINAPIENSWSISSIDELMEEEPFFSEGSEIIKTINDNLPLINQLESLLKQMPGNFSLQRHSDFYSSVPEFIVTQYSDSFQKKEGI